MQYMAQIQGGVGQRLYSNGRALVAAPRKPGPDWHRVGVHVHRRAA